MIRASLPLAALAALALAPTTTAQDISVSDGQVNYIMLRPTAGQADSPTALFTGDPTADTNVLFEHGWFYRISGDAQNNAFKDDGTLTVSNAGAHSDADWTNVDNRGMISAELDVDALSTGANSGVVTHRLTITNISGSEISLNVYNYIDIDNCAFAGNTASGAANRHRVNGPAGCPTFVEYYGAAIDLSCVQTFNASECGILTGPNDLDGTTPPFGPADYSGALQWRNQPLSPGESATFVVGLGHRDSNCPSADRRYGPQVDGAGGTPRIAVDPPVVGTTMRIQCLNCTANSVGHLVKGLRPLDMQFGSLTLLVDPLIVIVGGTPSSNFFFPTNIPNDTALCGGSAYLQWFVEDSAAPDGLSQTRGMHVVVGAY